MIQDILPYVYDNHFEEQQPDGDSFILYFKEDSVLTVERNGELSFPYKKELPSEEGPFIYLFSISGMRFFLTDSEGKELPEGTFKTKGQFRSEKPRHLVFAGITALQIALFYKKHRYCGNCGGEMRRDLKERMMFCDRCKLPVYPTISPAVIIGVTKGDKLLLTKYAGRANAPGYALVAGFAEVGETIEETVSREVMEETGIKVKNIRYYKSQPWSMSDTLLFGFFCEADGDDPIRVDETELSVAEWIPREEITTVFDGFSLTNEMITVFKEGKLPEIL